MMGAPTYAMMWQRLRLRQLRVAVAIADHGSVVRAAQVLGLTQPAATRNLLELEDYLDVRLFERLPRGVAATPAGLTVLTRARRILAEVERIPADLALLKAGMVDALVIGVLPSAATGLMPQVLTRFKATHQQTVVELIEGRMQEQLALLAARKIDLVVGRLYEPPNPDSFIRDALFDEPLAILARYGHPLFNENECSAASISAFPFILPTLEQRIGQDVEIALRDGQLRPQEPALRASSMSMIREVVLTSDSLTVLSGLTMVGDLVRGLVRIVPFPLSKAARPGGLVYRADTPGVEAFRRVLRDYVDDAVALGHLRRLER